MVNFFDLDSKFQLFILKYLLLKWFDNNALSRG